MTDRSSLAPQTGASRCCRSTVLRLPDHAGRLRVPALPQVEPLEQAAQVLSRQRSLLVLDNLEHLVESGVVSARRLLDHAPELTCLVTTRHCLDLRGEPEFVVHPLPTPHPDQGPEELVSRSSVRLFVDRAVPAKKPIHP